MIEGGCPGHFTLLSSRSSKNQGCSIFSLSFSMDFSIISQAFSMDVPSFPYHFLSFYLISPSCCMDFPSFSVTLPSFRHLFPWIFHVSPGFPLGKPRVVHVPPAQDKAEFAYEAFNRGRDFGPLDLAATVRYCQWMDHLVPRGPVERWEFLPGAWDGMRKKLGEVRHDIDDGGNFWKWDI